MDALISVPNNAKGVNVVVNGAALATLLKGQNGPVYSDMIRRAQLVQDAAKKQIRMGRVRSGSGSAGTNLRNTVIKRVVKHGDGIALIVGSYSPIALLHHNGTRPHVILPKRAKILAFPASSGGVIFARKVNHPGTKPNRYLTDNLHLAL